MKDAKTIIMSCFSSEEQHEDGQITAEEWRAGSSRPINSPHKNLWRADRVGEWRNPSALT